jgi:hypothetical protein
MAYLKVLVLSLYLLGETEKSHENLSGLALTIPRLSLVISLLKVHSDTVMQNLVV